MALQKSDYEEMLLSMERIEDCVREGIPPHSGYKKAAMREVTKVKRFFQQLARQEIE